MSCSFVLQLKFLEQILFFEREPFADKICSVNSFKNTKIKTFKRISSKAASEVYIWNSNNSHWILSRSQRSSYLVIRNESKEKLKIFCLIFPRKLQNYRTTKYLEVSEQCYYIMIQTRSSQALKNKRDPFAAGLWSSQVLFNAISLPGSYKTELHAHGMHIILIGHRVFKSSPQRWTDF